MEKFRDRSYAALSHAKIPREYYDEILFQMIEIKKRDLIEPEFKFVQEMHDYLNIVIAKYTTIQIRSGSHLDEIVNKVLVDFYKIVLDVYRE